RATLNDASTGVPSLRNRRVSSLEQAVALGGTTLVEPAALPGDYGRFAVFADPDGNPVGLWG
ncbi:hypothetical protein AB0C31_43770, partial [Actinoplanes philippinensis]